MAADPQKPTVSRAVPELTSDGWDAAEQKYSDRLYLGASSNSAVSVLNPTDRPEVLVTAPHGVVHVRDNQDKMPDLGTGSFAELVAKASGCAAVITARGGLPDAAWYDDHPLKTQIRSLDPRPSVLIDFHGMSDQRNLDIELGLGICANRQSLNLADYFQSQLLEAGLAVAVHEKYLAPQPTMLCNWARTIGIPATLQVELAARTRRPLATEETATRILGVVSVILRGCVAAISS